MKVFLGGTTNSDWRDSIAPKLKLDFFNPTGVKNKDEIDLEYANSDFHLYLITPKFKDITEIDLVINNILNCPEKTIFCFIKQDNKDVFNEDEIIDMTELGKTVEESGGKWCKNFDEILDFLNFNNLKNITPSELPQGFNDIFISYGRKHSLKFVKDLFQKLTKNYNLWFDINDIPLGVNFQKQIDDGIKKADNFIFVISPHSVKSEYCRKEIELAIKYNKRIIPILHVMPYDNFDLIHPIISKLNWIYFDSQGKFEPSYNGLIELLESHKIYIKKHTTLLNKATEWNKNQRPTKLLTTGKERIEAEEWLMTKQFYNNRNEEVQPPCLPTNIHCDYICKAKKNANNMMTDVFISYATENTKLCRNISLALARFGITCWLRDKDINTGVDLKDPIKKGIERADTILFLISNKSATSKHCKMELNYALKYNKRILPLLIEETDFIKIPTEIRKLHYIDFTDNFVKNVVTNINLDNVKYDAESQKSKTAFEKDIDGVISVLNDESSYYNQHKIFLTHAIKWEQQNYNPSILLRGYNLENAKTWLKLGEQKSHPPTQLQDRFINESSSKSGIPGSEVFISYSRSESDFARKLNEELQIIGKTTWFDQESIVSNSNFQDEIYKGIADSNNFLFIISPEAINSNYCNDELSFAIKSNKNIILLLFKEMATNQLPDKLAAIQCINFTSRDFHTSFSELIRTLNTDHDYIQKHTKYSQLAIDWAGESNINPEEIDKLPNQNQNKLLKGNEFAIANNWLNEAHKANKQPKPNPILVKYINNSNEAIKIKEKKKKRELLILRSLLGLASIAFIVLLLLTNGVRSERKETKNLLKAIIADKNVHNTLIDKKNLNILDNSEYYDLFKTSGITKMGKGNYSDALLNFRIAKFSMTYGRGTSEIKSLITKTKKLWSNKITADSLFANGNLNNAKSKYKEILNENSTDRASSTKLASIDLTLEIWKLTIANRDPKTIDSLAISGYGIDVLPIEIGELTELMDLNISRNNLKTVPKEIRNLTKLETLNLSACYMTKLPVIICDLENLTALNLNMNMLLSLPTEIGQLKKLKKLNISQNQQKFSIPSTIGDIENLEVLDLSGNKLQSIPIDIGRLSKLKKLYLDWNLLANLPKQISNLTNLEDLNLAGNSNLNHSEVIPMILKNKKLKKLNLSACNITTIVDYITGNENLEVLNLSKNQIAKDELNKIKTLLPNCKISMNSGQFTGQKQDITSITKK